MKKSEEKGDKMFYADAQWRISVLVELQWRQLWVVQLWNHHPFLEAQDLQEL